LFNQFKTLKMKIKSIILFVVVILNLQFTLQAQDDFVIREGSDSYYTEGQLEKCFLKEVAIVDGFSCTKWIHYYDDGTLRRFTISEPDTFQGLFFPAKSTLFMTKNQTLEKCWFGKKTTVHDLPIFAGYKNITISFFEDGSFFCCFLSKKHEIQGIVCQNGIVSPVFFYPSGKLKRCTVGKKTKIQNLVLKAGTIIDLDEEGRITSTSG